MSLFAGGICQPYVLAVTYGHNGSGTAEVDPPITTGREAKGAKNIGVGSPMTKAEESIKCRHRAYLVDTLSWYVNQFSRQRARLLCRRSTLPMCCCLPAAYPRHSSKKSKKAVRKGRHAGLKSYNTRRAHMLSPCLCSPIPFKSYNAGKQTPISASCYSSHMPPSLSGPVEWTMALVRRSFPPLTSRIPHLMREHRANDRGALHARRRHAVPVNLERKVT